MKTSEAKGEVLDYLVAHCVELSKKFPIFLEGEPMSKGNYTTDWALAGPIIEREYISVLSWLVGTWKARALAIDGKEFICEGPTPLVAAMRAYVASKLGDEVEIPEGLGEVTA